jgi:hypothetical protein
MRDVLRISDDYIARNGQSKKRENFIHFILIEEPPARTIGRTEDSVDSRKRLGIRQ